MLEFYSIFLAALFRNFDLINLTRKKEVAINNLHFAIIDKNIITLNEYKYDSINEFPEYKNRYVICIKRRIQLDVAIGLVIK